MYRDKLSYRTHPGGGVPLVTLSGKIVAELVEEDNQEQTRSGKRLS